MFDVLIIGSGPSGMTAAIYAKRMNLNVAVVERSAPGGAMVTTASRVACCTPTMTKMSRSTWLVLVMMESSGVNG